MFTCAEPVCCHVCAPETDSRCLSLWSPPGQRTQSLPAPAFLLVAAWCIKLWWFNLPSCAAWCIPLWLFHDALQFITIHVQLSCSEIWGHSEAFCELRVLLQTWNVGSVDLACLRSCSLNTILLYMCHLHRFPPNSPHGPAIHTHTHTNRQMSSWKNTYLA